MDGGHYSQGHLYSPQFVVDYQGLMSFTIYTITTSDKIEVLQLF